MSATMTKTRKPRAKPARSARITCWPLPGKPGVLTLTVGTLDTVYRFEPIPTPLGTAYRLEKATAGSDPTQDAYDVLLATDGRHACGCRGFARHQQCKHVCGLAALLAAGKL
jgi:hypothetical protein